MNFAQSNKYLSHVGDVVQNQVSRQLQQISSKLYSKHLVKKSVPFLVYDLFFSKALLIGMALNH